MTTTPPDAPTGPSADTPHEGPRATREEVRDLGRLRRTVENRKVAGVAGGLARHLDIDPLVLRVAFVVLAFFGGAGIILYVACWLLVPEDGSAHARLNLDERSRTVALVLVGVLAAFALLGDSWGVYWFPWPIVLIGLVAWLFLSRQERSRSPEVDAGEELPAATTAYRAQESYSSRPRPRDPRKRGPILFWFTLALIVLACGTIGILDVAGLVVPSAAYPAVSVAVTGVMLVVGAFYGRAGGLILLGLLLTLGLVGAAASDHWDPTERRVYAPTTAAAVQDVYEFGAGEMVLDLSRVEDLEELDGREIRIQGGAGSIDLIVPEGVDVDVNGRIGGPGSVNLFGELDEGLDNSVQHSLDGGASVPTITIDAELGIGEIYAESE